MVLSLGGTQSLSPSRAEGLNSWGPTWCAVSFGRLSPFLFGPSATRDWIETQMDGFLGVVATGGRLGTARECISSDRPRTVAKTRRNRMHKEERLPPGKCRENESQLLSSVSLVSRHTTSSERRYCQSFPQ